MSHKNSGIAFSKLQRLAKIEQDSDTRFAHVDSDADKVGLLQSITLRQQVGFRLRCVGKAPWVIQQRLDRHGPHGQCHIGSLLPIVWPVAGLTACPASFE